MSRIPVLAEVTSANALLAETIRQDLAARNIWTLNMIASPGAGKTTLIERTIAALGKEFRFGVIEGDLSTSLDAERIIAAGAPAVQINTGGGCHLEARMILQAMKELTLDGLDVLIIENVGNLICPTAWDLGEDCKVVVASLPEGDDKPLKYPVAFLCAQAVVINKIDLEPFLPASVQKLRENALRINGALEIFPVSCLTGAGLEAWFDWLRARVRHKRAAGSRP